MEFFERLYRLTSHKSLFSFLSLLEEKRREERVKQWREVLYKERMKG
jgi:hypothetical protein